MFDKKNPLYTLGATLAAAGLKQAIGSGFQSAVMPKKSSRAKTSRKRKSYSAGRKKTGRKSKVKKIESRVRALEKREKEGEVLFLGKLCASKIHGCNQGEAAYDNEYAFNTGTVTTILSKLQVWDPATNSFIDGDFTFGGEGKNLTIDSFYSSVTVKNNCGPTCIVTVYIVEPRTGETATPVSALTDAVVDIRLDNTMNLNNRLVFPSDCPSFGSKWKTIATKKFTLLPGRQRKVTHAVKDIVWKDEIGYADYDKRLKSFVYLVRLEGAVGHVSGPVRVGALDCTVDLMYEQVARVKYDGGINATRLSVQDTSTTGTTIGTLYEYQMDHEKQTQAF